MTNRDEREAAATARHDAYITKLVDAAPPLTPEQRVRLAVLLAPPLVGRTPNRGALPARPMSDDDRKRHLRLHGAAGRASLTSTGTAGVLEPGAAPEDRGCHPQQEKTRPP